MWLSQETSPTSYASGEARIRRILLRAAKYHIPTGCQRDRPDRLMDEARDVARERDRLRTLNLADRKNPLLENQETDQIAKNNTER